AGEIPLLDRRPLHRVLVLRDEAGEDQGFGAAADPAVAGADEHLVRARFGQRLRADLAVSGSPDPPRPHLVGHRIFRHRHPPPNRTAAAPVFPRQRLSITTHGGTVPKVQSGPAIGLMVQIVLLAVLDQIVWLSAASWSVGAAYAAGTCLMLTRGLRRSGATRLGPADRVTLTRAILVGGVTALTVD